MTGPDRIYLDADADAEDGYFPRCFADPKYCNEPAIEYIRRDPAVLAALPEVQALIRQAVEAEREACAKEALDQFHCGYPDEEGVWWDHDPAQVGREISAAIRKRGEG